MKNVARMFASAVFFAGLLRIASAGIPETIAYQGRLTDAAGVPVNATVGMTFSLYTDPTGTSAVWTETQSGVSVQQGAFTVALGSVTPIPSTVFSSSSLSLGISVNGDAEMTPRLALTSAPYTYRSGCNAGDMMTCYTGDLATLGKGLCKAGVRTCDSAGTGFGNCIGEITPNCGEACKDFSTDPENCGGCGSACSVQNGTAGCSNSACTVASCSLSWGDCNGVAGDGCETDTGSEPSHCGGCGKPCFIANGTAGCGSGACTVASCVPGYGNCDNNAANGCETNTLGSPNHCGACGNSCNGGTCFNGVCL